MLHSFQYYAVVYSGEAFVLIAPPRLRAPPSIPAMARGWKPKGKQPKFIRRTSLQPPAGTQWRPPPPLPPPPGCSTQKLRPKEAGRLGKANGEHTKKMVSLLTRSEVEARTKITDLVIDDLKVPELSLNVCTCFRAPPFHYLH